jgi:DNA-binding MarR family transcriptional regulator
MYSVLAERVLPHETGIPHGLFFRKAASIRPKVGPLHINCCIRQSFHSTPINSRGGRVTQDEIREFRRDLRVLEREIELTLTSQTGCCGVTVAQCHLLLEVELRGQTSVTELASVLELDKSTLSRSVDGLCRAGLLDRVTDPSSRRQQVISLTAQGKAKAAAINGLCDRFYMRLIDSIPAGKRNAARESVALVAEAMKTVRKQGGNPCIQ